MKISVITVSFNAANTIADALGSVASQTYSDIEHLVIDGASSDSTVDVIRRNKSDALRWISEPDSGIYHAMNKGIVLATGDVIGFLNADDIYAGPDALSHVAGAFDSKRIDACYADLVYVRPGDDSKVVRYFSSKSFSPARLAYGQMPAHPTLYLRRNMFDKFGLFKTDYQIAADYELVARMFANSGVRSVYLDEVLVKMRTGGVSTQSWKSNVILNREILRACRENGISTNLCKIYSKYLVKVLQLIRRPA